MPELPEVQAARNLLEAECVGKAITKVIAADDNKVFVELTPAQLETTLLGKTPLAAKRLGKHCWLDFGPATPCLLLHFGMTGGAVVRGGGPLRYQRYSVDDSEWPPAHVKLELHFDDGTEWAFCDSRRFARIRLIPGDPTRVPPLSELGWDPLFSMPPLSEFSAALARKNVAIKALLLDQKFTAGVGNWVADECLYQARIHPEKKANALSAKEAEDLHAQIQEVCRLASSVDADSARYPITWLFHHRWSKGKAANVSIDGHAVKHVTVGGRTSAYVPALQKLTAGEAAAEVEGEGEGEEGELGVGERKKKLGVGEGGGEGGGAAGGKGKNKRAAGGNGGGRKKVAVEERKRGKKGEEGGAAVVGEEMPAAPAEVGGLEDKERAAANAGRSNTGGKAQQQQGGAAVRKPRPKKKVESKPKAPSKAAQKLRAAASGRKTPVVRPK